MVYTTFLEKIIIPIGDIINRSNYMKMLRYWRNVDSFSEEKLKTLQKENLTQILQYAVENIEQYKTIKLQGNDPYKWVEQFPVLTKADLRNNPDKLISKNKSNLIKYSSSGSTGMQTSVYMSKKEQANIRAILTHWWEWSGYRVGNPIIQTGITPNRSVLKSIKDLLFNTTYISAFNHTENQLKNVCDKINHTSNHFLAGYASSLNVIAEYALKNNYNIQLKSVISLGDKLFDGYDKTIKQAFKCKVYDTYGCNEGFLIASQKDLEYKYIMIPHVYLEILDDRNNPVADGELGNVVVTRLDGFSMPLIRYKIGDLAKILPRDKYPKQRNFNYPLLEKIIGRETDIVILPNDEKMVVHSFTGIFEYIQEIKQFQVIQENINSITINYIPSKNFTLAVLNTATDELQKHINNIDFKIYYRKVDVIEPSKSGKPQIIISKLAIS